MTNQTEYDRVCRDDERRLVLDDVGLALKPYVRLFSEFQCMDTLEHRLTYRIISAMLDSVRQSGVAVDQQQLDRIKTLAGYTD